MKEKLFTFYKDNASNRALIYKHMLWFQKIVLLILMLNFISLVTVVTLFIFTNKISILFMWIVILESIMISLGVNKMFDIKAMKILKKHYHIPSTPQTWGDYVTDIRITKITEYLMEHEMYQRWKIERLILTLQKDGERGRIPPLVAPSIILALSIPNLTQLFSQIYTYYNLEQNMPSFILGFEHPKMMMNTLLFSFFFIISLLILWLLSISNRIYEALKRQIVDKHAAKRSGLIETLENILYLIKDKGSN